MSFWFTLIPIVCFKHVSVLDPILSSLAHHPPFHALLFSCAHLLSDSAESFLAPVLYFCISSLDPALEGGGVHMHLCMSSNSPHLACRDITFLSYPLLLPLIKLPPFLQFPFWRLTKFPVDLSQYSHVRLVLQCYFSDVSRLYRSSAPCRWFSSVLFPSLLLCLPR